MNPKLFAFFLLATSLIMNACQGKRTPAGDADADADTDGDSDGDECGDLRLPLEGEPQQVVNGTTDFDPNVVNLTEGQALAVGAIMTIQERQWDNSCTATLIAPRLVLTAAHCVIDLSNPWNPYDYHPRDLQFAIGPDASSPQHMFAVAEVHSHPSYQGIFENTASHDIGVLVLEEDATAVVPGLQPIPANCEGLDEGSFVVQDVQNVGYGITEPITDYWSPPPENHRRYWTVEEVVELTSFDFVVYGHGESAVCNGDSGGPSLWQMPDGSTRVVGTVSWGDPTCVDYDHFARVDASCDFIEGYLEGCGDITEEGSCDAFNAVYCDNGAVIERDCASLDLGCGDDGSGRWRCVEIADPCADETWEGRCDGDLAIWCEDEGIRSVDCPEEERVCARNEEGLSRCVDEDPCADLDWEGRCDGDTALWCDEGQLRERRCDDCGQECGFNDDVGGYYCL